MLIIAKGKYLIKFNIHLWLKTEQIRNKFSIWQPLGCMKGKWLDGDMKELF